MEKYLDISKSVIISSPAGSGKTEKLARRYVSLLLGGSEIEKILAITFTEKAATEMKQRILGILKKENPGLFAAVVEKMPLMRISTIHAFCLKLLKRFSIELGHDPSLEVMDEFTASSLWADSVYESLMNERENPDLFFDMIVSRGMKGWDSLYRTLNELHKRRPHADLMIRERHPADGEEKKILDLYERCLRRYSRKKIERRLIDFNDIELLSYEAIIKNPQWQNILYSFDEHTDHILIDEFQDTSSLQWKIIDRLTEEWRSGMGAKRDSGKVPTIFLVGDEKQSIYLFRGANVSLFGKAKELFSEWLGREYHFEEIRENYRSLPEIVNFTNSLFSRLMQPGLYESWRTTYTPFRATRDDKGSVELIIAEGGENTRKNRETEAEAMAGRILSLYGRYEVWEEDKKRACTFGDMAILLRKRTHLTVFEDVLRRHGIPFIVVKGIGFYDEPEVAILRELLSVIIDPLDDYSLFCVLRSPLFSIGHRTLFGLISRSGVPLVEKMRTSKNAGVNSAFSMIASWIEKAQYIPVAELLDDALSGTGGWRYFWEKQRHVNIKKFINLVGQYESQGYSLLEIREKLILSKSGEEAKANINTEGMNAVKITTVHAAKGLQFPMVFLPSLDEENAPRSSSIVLEEDDETLFLAYEEDSQKRKKMEHFLRRKEKELEEEKRLFYVAVTRAQDFLCMLAAPKKDKQHSGRLAYITGNLGHIDSLRILNAPEADSLHTPSRPSQEYAFVASAPFFRGPVYTEPLPYEPRFQWRDVTEDPDIRVRHGEDWVLLGRVFHSLFEELSKGIIQPDDIGKRAMTLLRNEVFTDTGRKRLLETILDDFRKLDASRHLEGIILPRENSFSELPFILRSGSTIFRGRIDRVILRGETAFVYDYKTYPVKERELPELRDKYRYQMEIYSNAAEKLFSKKVRGYLLFTHNPFCIEYEPG